MSYLDNLFNIAGKQVVVTGACGFFGTTICQRLLEAGANVLMVSSNPKVERICLNLDEEYGGGRCEFTFMNMYSAHEHSLHLLFETYYRANVLINNAYDFSSYNGFNDKLLNTDKGVWMRGLESGLYWPAAMSKAFVESSLKAESIINIASMYSHVSPSPDLYEGSEYWNPIHYSTAKAGLLGLTRYTAALHGKKGIRCNAISPGPFPKKIDAKFRNRLKKRTCLNRVGVPEELMGAIIYLASDASSYMTGQSIVIDGGWTIT